jgi:hypothetical protein
MTDKDFNFTTSNHRPLTKTDDSLEQTPPTGLTDSADVSDAVELQANDSEKRTTWLDFMKRKASRREVRMDHSAGVFNSLRTGGDKELIINVKQVERRKRRETRGNITVNDLMRERRRQHLLK